MLEYEQVNPWLKEAGALALQYYRNVKPSVKSDKTYVTEADLAVQSFLNEKIIKNYPDVGILSEEADYTRKPQDGETYFVLDPIDGTAMFVSGLPVWGISLGVIKSGKAIAGFFKSQDPDSLELPEDQPIKKILVAEGRSIADEISATAEEEGCNYIAMGCKQKGFIEKTMGDNVVRKVLKRSAVPVLVVPFKK